MKKIKSYIKNGVNRCWISYDDTDDDNRYDDDTDDRDYDTDDGYDDSEDEDS